MPLAGTATTLPAPPAGINQRRLTFTHQRRYPGLVNVPRHWVRANPQATEIAFLMRDDAGVVQLWLIPPAGGEPRQLTHTVMGIQSAFNWHPSGAWLGCVVENKIALCDARSGAVSYLTNDREKSAVRGCRRIFHRMANTGVDGRRRRLSPVVDNRNAALA